MTIYIALLRGINVGGKNMIKMADLKQALEAIGLLKVKTYIQSGNVLFKSDEEDETLHKKIESKIEEAFGFQVAVILRTAEEIKQVVDNCPFSDKEILEAESTSEGECLYVSLLSQVPSEEKLGKLSAYKGENEEYRINGREVYLLFRSSIRNSKLANNLQRLDVPSTVRNWKTMNKLVALAKEMEG